MVDLERLGTALVGIKAGPVMDGGQLFDARR
jgi:hypothetical protein